MLTLYYGGKAGEVYAIAWMIRFEEVGLPARTIVSGIGSGPGVVHGQHMTCPAEKTAFRWVEMAEKLAYRTREVLVDEEPYTVVLDLPLVWAVGPLDVR